MARKEVQLKQASAAEYLTIEEAARELGIKPSVLRNYLSEGKLTTYKFKTLALVSRDSIKEYRQKRQ
jgi:excisionase family DNA binding protein